MDHVERDRLESLCDWAVAVYRAPEVASACLELQDRHDQNVCLLLWAAWSGAEDPEIMTRAAQVAERWEAAITGPLRAVRRALKEPQDGVLNDAQNDAYAAVLGAEITTENALLRSLDGLSPRVGGEPMTGLSLASMAWRSSAPAEALSRLALALQAAEADRDQADLLERLDILRRDHGELDVAIETLTAAPLPDMMLIGRLKRKKLALKDAIARLEDELTPDIIA